MGAGEWSIEPSCSFPIWPKKPSSKPRTAKARGSGQAEATWKIFLNSIALSHDPATDPQFPQFSSLLLGGIPRVIFRPRLGSGAGPPPQPSGSSLFQTWSFTAGAEGT